MIVDALIAIAPTAALYGIATTPELMADLRTMEAAAIAAFAEGERRRR